MESGDSSVIDDITDYLSNFISQKKLPIQVPNFHAHKSYESLSQIHNRAKSVYPDCFVGAKITTVRDIADRIKLSQQYNFKYRKDPFASFAHYLYKEMTPKADQALLIDTSGSGTATYTERIDSEIDVKVTSKIKDLTASEVEVSIGRSTELASGSVSFCVEDVNPHSLKIAAQYLHRLSSKFCVGVEMKTTPLSYSARPDFSLSARYSPPICSMSTTIGRNGFQICFFKRFSRDLKLASVVDYGHYADKMTLSLAVQYSIGNDSILKMFVDSNNSGGFTFEKYVYIREANTDLKILRIVASTLMDNRRRVEFGIGFFLDL